MSPELEKLIIEGKAKLQVLPLFGSSFYQIQIPAGEWAAIVKIKYLPYLTAEDSSESMPPVSGIDELQQVGYSNGTTQSALLIRPQFRGVNIGGGVTQYYPIPEETDVEMFSAGFFTISSSKTKTVAAAMGAGTFSVNTGAFPVTPPFGPTAGANVQVVVHGAVASDFYVLGKQYTDANLAGYTAASAPQLIFAYNGTVNPAALPATWRGLPGIELTLVRIFTRMPATIKL